MPRRVMGSLGRWIDTNPLRVLRQNRGLTQQALGSAAGVHYTSVYDWERGRAFPRPGNLIMVAHVLDVLPTTLRQRLRAWHKRRPRGKKR